MDSVSFYCFQLQLNGMQTFHYAIVQNRTHVVGWLYSAGPYIIHSTAIRDHLCMRQANERRRYIVTSPLIGWAHTQSDPCVMTEAEHHATSDFELTRHPIFHPHRQAIVKIWLSIVKIWGENCLCYNGSALCRYAQDTSIVLDVSFAWQLCLIWLNFFLLILIFFLYRILKFRFFDIFCDHFNDLGYWPTGEKTVF